MSASAIRTTSRIAFVLWGLISLFTGVPFLMLRGSELPDQSEWVIFVAILVRGLICQIGEERCGTGGEA